MGGLKKGDTLLVQVASTATGQASVDFGPSLGAKVYATSRADKLDKVRALGAEALEYGDPKVRELEANVASTRSAPTRSPTASRRSRGREPSWHQEQSATRWCPSTSGHWRGSVPA